MNKVKIIANSRLVLNEIKKIILPKNAICHCRVYDHDFKKTFSLQIRGFLPIDPDAKENTLEVSVMVIDCDDLTDSKIIDCTEWYSLVDTIKGDTESRYKIIVHNKPEQR